MKLLCIIWLIQNKNEKIGYICKNYILAKKLYKDVMQLLPEELVKSSNGSDLTITSIYDTVLTFFSSESGSSLRGLTFEYLILDEFAFFKQKLSDGSDFWYDVCFPTIKVKGKKIIFVSTPLGKNNHFHTMFLRGLDPNYHRYRTIKKTIYDDGLITNEEIEEVRKSIPETSFRQEFLCEFLDSSITFFVGFECCFTSYNYNNNIKQWIGIDLSGNGDDESVVTFINEQNQTQQITIKGRLDDKYKQIADIINSTHNLIGVNIEQNGIGQPMINEITKLVNDKSIIHNWLTTNSTKEQIISNLAVMIANNNIKFNNNNTKLYTQLSNFIVKYSKTNKLQFEGVNGTHDDAVMSLAIAIQCKEEYKYTNNITFARRMQTRKFI